MKKTRFFTVLLTLALVLGLSAALTVAVCADTADGAETTPAKVYINDSTLMPGEYYYKTGDSFKTDSKLPFGVRNYAYYNRSGVLELHDFSIKYDGNETETVIMVVAGDPEAESTFQIKLYGQNKVVMDEADFTKAIFAGTLDLVISANNSLAGLNVITEGDGITGESITVKSGNITVDSKGIAFFTLGGDINITGGNIKVVDSIYGLCTMGDVRISGGNTDITAQIENYIDFGTDSEKALTKAEASEKKLSGEQIGDVYYLDSEAIRTYQQFYMTGGTLTVNARNNGIAVLESPLVVTGGKIIVNKVGDNGLECDYGDIMITGGEIIVREAGKNGLFAGAYDVEDQESSINISGAKVSVVKAGEYGLKATGGIMISNSDVEAFSADKENGAAFNVSPEISGSSAVNAGPGALIALPVPQNADLSGYAYAHIYPGKTQSSIIAKINDAAKTIITWLSGFSAGTSLFKSIISKLLIPLIILF